MKNSKIKHIGMKHISIEHSSIKNSKVNNMKNKGFTLIELIVVMVILGIMSITVAPRFLNMTGDAHRSLLDGAAAAINSSSAMVYGKALVRGIHNDASDTDNKIKDDLGNDITLGFGYPTASLTGVIGTLDIDIHGSDVAANEQTGDFEYHLTAATNGDPGFIYIYHADAKVQGASITDETACAIKYTEAASASVPAVVTSHFTGC